MDILNGYIKTKSLQVGLNGEWVTDSYLKEEYTKAAKERLVLIYHAMLDNNVIVYKDPTGKRYIINNEGMVTSPDHTNIYCHMNECMMLWDNSSDTDYPPFVNYVKGRTALQEANVANGFDKDRVTGPHDFLELPDYVHGETMESLYGNSGITSQSDGTGITSQTTTNEVVSQIEENVPSKPTLKYTPLIEDDEVEDIGECHLSMRELMEQKFKDCDLPEGLEMLKRQDREREAEETEKRMRKEKEEFYNMLKEQQAIEQSSSEETIVTEEPVIEEETSSIKETQDKLRKAYAKGKEDRHYPPIEIEQHDKNYVLEIRKLNPDLKLETVKLVIPTHEDITNIDLIAKKYRLDSNDFADFRNKYIKDDNEGVKKAIYESKVKEYNNYWWAPATEENKLNTVIVDNTKVDVLERYGFEKEIEDDKKIEILPCQDTEQDIYRFFYDVADSLEYFSTALADPDYRESFSPKEAIWLTDQWIDEMDVKLTNKTNQFLLDYVGVDRVKIDSFSKDFRNLRTFLIDMVKHKEVGEQVIEAFDSWSQWTLDSVIRKEFVPSKFGGGLQESDLMNIANVMAPSLDDEDDVEVYHIMENQRRYVMNTKAEYIGIDDTPFTNAVMIDAEDGELSTALCNILSGGFKDNKTSFLITEKDRRVFSVNPCFCKEDAIMIRRIK